MENTILRPYFLKTATSSQDTFLQKIKSFLDPRARIALLLFSYLVLGVTVLGFNREPTQIIITSLAALLCELTFYNLFCPKDKRKLFFPLSALITSFSLSLLLNYSHGHYLLLVPVFFAIGSKHILTFKGRHILNPAQAGVSFSLIFCGHLITSSPAYQWNGIGAMGAFSAGCGLFFLVPQVKRFPLVFSFLAVFTLQTALRAWLMKHHLPFETLFLGTLTSPAFFLFTFFMITDPKTSPSDTKSQIITGSLLAVLDLIFHIKQSYYTFFYAGLTLQLGKLFLLHSRELRKVGIKNTLNKIKGLLIKLFILSAIAFFGVTVYKSKILPTPSLEKLSFSFNTIPLNKTNLGSEFGNVLKRVDPRITHFSKWLLSVGDSVSVGDYDNDGLVDIFLTNILKKGKYRSALYKNKGDFSFERVKLPALKNRPDQIEEFGLNTNAQFVDYDNDGDLDLFLSYAFGHSIMLKNMLNERGEAKFKDVTKDLGFDKFYTNSVSATFFDFNKDGLLDVIIGQVWPENLPDYPKENPKKLNLFNLPKKEYEGDKRMFNFMHASWHMADNGGRNILLIQTKKGTFIEKKELALPETFWTLALTTGDFNRDGWTDIYVANDFGPDNLYYNNFGQGLKKIEGNLFGSIGKDTYKGMNASFGDVDRNGYLDIYVSNVHHAMQAEGSLLWMFYPKEGQKEAQGNIEELGLKKPLIKDEATQLGALNEQRFGWGASIVDFNNDGHLDISQANGMVDDKIDRTQKNCPDYWYVNEKIARSAPSIHRYAHNWGDIRGHCIYGNEKDRLYLNTGKANGVRFIDVSEEIGMTEALNSRGMAAADFNDDGLMDLVVTHIFSNPTLFKNKWNEGEKEKNPFIGLNLQYDFHKGSFKNCSRQAIGTRVELHYQNKKGKQVFQVREVSLATGFSAQNDTRVHFGLGDYALNSNSLELKVLWCGNEKTEIKLRNKLSLNQYKTLSKKGFLNSDEGHLK
ncbi:MAG: FG-GAP-like repeat-containing protein [Bdellovibrionota bacterium]|nr:FG-GAP-like repeat-containing protein [Bdellovibrionota bacterium]